MDQRITAYELALHAIELLLSGEGVSLDEDVQYARLA